MKLGPGPFTITIRGDTKAFLACPRSSNTLHYVIDTLFMGGEIDVSEAESWGLTITQEAVDD